MAGISKLMDDVDEQKAIQELKSLGNSGVVANKLRAVIATRNHSIISVAKIFNITRMTLNNWIKAFKASGSIALASQPKKPKNSKLSEENIQKIEEWIQVNSSITLRELRLKIIDELGVSVSTTTVHRVIQKLKFSYITPRPRHYKQDPLLQAEFKKKSTSDSKGES